jgi:hypothetical protein
LAAGLVAVCLAAFVGALLFFVSTNNQIRLQGDAEHALQLANRSQTDNLRMTCEVMSQSIASNLESKILALEEVASMPKMLDSVDAETPFENRVAIEAILEAARVADFEDDAVMSWFVLDSRGNLLARSSDNTSVVANNQPRWTRPYFHGGETNLDATEYGLLHGNDLPTPIKQTYLSPVFDALPSVRSVGRSVGSVASGDDQAVQTKNQQRLYSLSTPIKNKDQVVVGVVGLTLRAGMLQPLKRMRSATGERYVSLVESRGELSGALVDHTGWQDARESPRDSSPINNYVECDKELLAQLISPAFASQEESRREANVESDLKSSDRDPRLLEDYCDPNKGAFAGKWLAFTQPIFINSRKFGATNCGWYLIVQDRPFEILNSAD